MTASMTFKTLTGAVVQPANAPQPRIPFEVCPLCGGRDKRALGTADCTGHPLYHPLVPPLIAWLRCEACGHVFTDGYFAPEVSEAVFGRTLEHQQIGWKYEQQRPVAARMVERVLPHASEGAWLDVGFGNGALLLTAAEWGFEPVGIDLRASNVAALAATGIEAHCVDLADLDHTDRYAVISMADVLEHIAYPKQALATAHRLLAPEGCLFVSMPAYDSPLWRQLDAQKANPYWAELEHFHNFSRPRLYALLGEMGFAPVRYGVSERYRAGMEVVARKA